jgi:tricorn protease
VRRSIALWSVLLTVAALCQAQSGTASGGGAGGGTRLLRTPDIHGDTVVFSYAGDLWLANVAQSASGGAARRLTSHPGEELFPKFSPDGRMVAFTGQYSGNLQAHVIPVEGGEPKQLTFRNDIGEIPPRGGYDNQVLGWTPDGKQVLFRGNRVPWNNRMGRPFLVPAAGGMETPLPVPYSGMGTLSPDGNRMVYAPIMREFRTWKRHKGGRAQDLWIYDLARNTSEQITDFAGTDNQPAWIGDTIYFTSDRTAAGGDALGKLNLWAFDTRSRQTRQVSNQDRWDVLWPSGDDRRVVYESGGWIWLFDPASGQNSRLDIRVTGDLPQTLPRFANVTANIQAMNLSPSGRRAAFEARGEIFTVPAEKGEIRNLTNTPGIREMVPAWSPDGKQIAYLSDRTGEYEIWVRPSDGSGAERQVTRGADSWRYPPLWSPDGKKLAFGDAERRLRYVEVDGANAGRIVEVDRSTRGDITDYRWSPDSSWLVYTKTGPTEYASIWVWSLEQRKPAQLTSGMTHDTEPVFDPTGRYLFFLSNRDFNLTSGSYDNDFLYNNAGRVYVGLLAQDGPGLFLPESDEEGEEKPKEGKESARKEGDKPAPVRIDSRGFEARVRAVPGPAGNYRSLETAPHTVYYIVDSDDGSQLRRYDLEARKEEVILSALQDYGLSNDGQKVLYRQARTFGVTDARPGQNPGAGKLPLEKLEMRIEPRAEWAQMYVDAWRTMRDWFYDPAMHGTDWKGLREQYGELVPHMGSRSDLEFILGELGAELSAGHVYADRGDDPRIERVENGLLGAEVEAHPSGTFRISHIYPGENWHEEFRSPLTEPGVDVKVGDLILAVDGQTTRGVDNFYRLLQNKGERVVTLKVNSRPSEDGAREVRVRPVKSEQGVRYLEWVQKTAAKVDKLSGGRIGYVHVPNTALEGTRAMYKYFLPQAYKEALIIDDRYNGGGFIPDRIIALVARRKLNAWAYRGTGTVNTPVFVHTGPKAMLINGEAGSGGDAFPYYFRKLGLGPLIGTRTWGGLIGLSFTPPLMDGGSLAAPSYRFLTTEGTWAIENEGVAPDFEVIDRPDAFARGEDPSVEAAVKYLLEQLEKNPPQKVTVPPPPVGGAVR